MHVYIVFIILYVYKEIRHLFKQSKQTIKVYPLWLKSLHSESMGTILLNKLLIPPPYYKEINGFIK